MRAWQATALLSAAALAIAPPAGASEHSSQPGLKIEYWQLGYFTTSPSISTPDGTLHYCQSAGGQAVRVVFAYQHLPIDTTLKARLIAPNGQAVRRFTLRTRKSTPPPDGSDILAWTGSGGTGAPPGTYKFFASAAGMSVSGELAVVRQAC